MTTLRRRKKGGNWFVDQRVQGQRVRFSTGTSDRQAALLYLADYERRSMLGIEKPHKIVSLKEIIRHYCNYLDARWSKPENEIHRLSQWQDYFYRLGIDDGERINPGHVREFLTLELSHHSDTTRNRYAAILKSCLNFAEENGLISNNPIRKYKMLKVPRRTFFFSKEEVRLLIDKAERDKPMQAAIMLAVYTGARRGELLYQRWCDIHFGRSPRMSITCHDEFSTKSLENRVVPLNPELIPILRELKNLNQTHGYVLQHFFVDDRGRLRPKRISKRFVDHRRRIGLPNGSFHDLRHTFASHLVLAGESLAVVQKLLGHSDYTMTLRYAHLTDDAGKESVRALLF